MTTLALQATPQTLSMADTHRYARHLSISEIGTAGQERLLASRVLVIGAGGLGAPVIMYLAAAGVGTIGIADADTVELSNLQRQVIHRADMVGAAKTASAKAFVAGISGGVKVITHNVMVTPENILQIAQDYDVVVDATDNFSTRYIVNDACVVLDKPCVWGSVFQFSGQVSVFWSQEGPCYRCFFPEPPPAEYAPSCAEGGVVGAVCGTVGSLQALEVVKLIVGSGEALTGTLLMLDALTGSHTRVTIPRDPDCPACGERAARELLPVPVTSCVVSNEALPTVTAEQLRAALGSLGDRLTVVDIRNEWEWIDGVIPGAILAGPDWLEKVDIPRKDGDRLVIYCQSGIRSARALRTALERGMSAEHLEGGMNAWNTLTEAKING